MKLTTKQLTLCAVLTGTGAGPQLSGKLFPPVSGDSHSGDQAGACQHRDCICPLCAGAGAGAADPDRPVPAGSGIRRKYECADLLPAGGLFRHAGDDSACPGFRQLSIYGVSIGGAAAHNCGQVAAACLTLGSGAPLYYLPILLGASLLTGAVTGVAAACLFRALRHTSILR